MVHKASTAEQVLEGAIASETVQSQSQSTTTVTPPSDSGTTTTPTPYTDHSTLNDSNLNSNSNSNPHLQVSTPTNKMESSSTTVAGSRDPTIKAGETSSVRSASASAPTGSAPLGETTSNEKALSEGKAEGDTSAEEDTGLLHGARLYLVFLSMMLTVFMFALDQSIVATAIPVIVSDFQAFAEVSWIITAYFLTQCGLILLVGQLLTIIKAKWVLLGAIFFFELGSLLCAVAVNMPMLIFARAIQGVGAAGMFVSLLAVIVTVTTLKQRPAFMAAFGFVFVISSVVGPLLGGVFTERLKWTWCFWINLPIGGAAAVAVVFLLPPRDPIRPDPNAPKGWRALREMDFLGSLLALAFVTCLLLALQWGGNNYAWSNWRIILLFTLGGILVIAFFLWQWYLDEKALIPLSLLRNRTQLAAMGAMFMLMIAMLGGTYQLPLFYQASRGRSPEQSGIDIIPFMLAVCIGIFVQGGFVTKLGRYWPFLVIGPPISAVGFGLLYTITPDIANPKLIGFQILAGFGVGLSFQNPLLAIQVEYHDRPHLIPQANGVVSFFQLTGAALGIGVVNTVQSIFLNRELRIRAPDVDFNLVRQSPVAIYQLPEMLRPPVIEAYTKAITESLIPIVVAVGVSWIVGMFIKNKSTLGKMTEGGIAA